MKSGVGSPVSGSTTPTHPDRTLSVGVPILCGMSLNKTAREVFLCWDWWKLNWRTGLQDGFPFCCVTDSLYVPRYAEA